jgi:hypothetical protein
MPKMFVSNLPAVTIAIGLGSAGGVQKAAYHVRNAVVVGLSGPRSGHTYKVPGTSKTYTASAPGEYPATATARLRSNFRVKMIGPSAYAVGTDVEYAPALEGIRPFLKDIFSKESDEAKLIIRGGGTQTRLTDARRWF